jgi:hypothetical protein
MSEVASYKDYQELTNFADELCECGRSYMEHDQTVVFGACEASGCEAFFPKSEVRVRREE